MTTTVAIASIHQFYRRLNTRLQEALANREEVDQMPNYMYVSLQDDDKILVFTMDAETGKFTPEGEIPVTGGPS